MSGTPVTDRSGTGRGPARNAVFVAAGWWPGIHHPSDGIFVREHAVAVGKLRPSAVVHLTFTRRIAPFSIRFEESVQDGTVVLTGHITAPMRRFGVHDRLVRMAYRRAITRLSDRFTFSVAHIHVHTPMTGNLLPVARENKWPVVVTEHSTFYHNGAAFWGEAEQTKFQHRMRRWFADPSIKAVLPVSRDLAKTLVQDYGVPPGDITVVPNISAPYFRPRSVATSPPFRIVLAAYWSGNKDPGLFLAALHLLPDDVKARLRIDWIGDGELIEPVRNAAAHFVAQGIMHFHGRLPKPELAELLAQAHLLVHPTKAENLPCIILESLCCGTPVLSHAVNGVPELVDDSNGVLCPPSDPKAFTEALLNIMEHPGRFDRARIAARAEQRFSASNVAKQIVAVYDSIAPAPRGT